MAIIRSGILGNTRGKVAGVVASQWKDKNYIREYVKPGNPNTPAQQIQRTKMSDAVNFARPLVGAVFNRFLDPFLKSLSGYNRFIQLNLAKFTPDVDFTTIQVVDGKLIPLPTFAAEATQTEDGLIITWEKDLLPADYATFPVHTIVYDSAKDLFYYFLDTASNIGDGTQTVPLTWEPNAELFVYSWYSQSVNNVLTNVAISTSALADV